VGKTDGQDRLKILIERRGTHIASQLGMPRGNILWGILFFAPVYLVLLSFALIYFVTYFLPHISLVFYLLPSGR
jgi:hypothetical protein